MIKGVVGTDRAAMTSLQIRGPNQRTILVDGLIDAGFTASLALSPTLATSLGLVPLTRTEATLADGATRLFEVCPVEVYWTNGWTSTLATIIGNEVLIGMSLLWGCELRLVAEDGGVVEIRAKPQSGVGDSGRRRGAGVDAVMGSTRQENLKNPKENFVFM